MLQNNTIRTIYKLSDEDKNQVIKQYTYEIEQEKIRIKQLKIKVEKSYELSKYISAGGYHNVALNNNGTVTSTGYNKFGQM